MKIQKIVKSESNGFTLIELMIVLAIVGIVSVIAVGGYLSWKPGYEFRGAVSQVRSDLNRAKMRAVETRRQCRVVFTAAGVVPVGYQLEDGNQVMNSSQWGNIAANKVFTQFPQGPPFRIVTLTDYPAVTVTPPASPLIFSPRGPATPANFTITHPTAGTAAIRVTITGMIEITWP